MFGRKLRIIILVSLLTLIACSKSGNQNSPNPPAPPPPPPPPPSGVDYNLLKGWWKATPANNLGYGVAERVYFGNDSFHFEHLTSQFSHPVGSWSKGTNDSLFLNVTGGAGSPLYQRLKINSLTSGILNLSKGNYFGTFSKFDSAAITSKPITTIAGTGIPGYSGDGGPAVNAKINCYHFAIDGTNNLYLFSENRIRKINSSTGNITTIAGTGNSGNSGDNGPAILADMNASSIAVAPNGNIFISDDVFHCIRKIDVSTGIISRVAGSGSPAPGFSGDGGPAMNAQLNAPAALSFDANGNLIFFDRLNFRIRRIASGTGIITTIAGNGSIGIGGDGGPALSAQLFPGEISVDPAGNIYIVDGNNFRIRKITASTGIINTIAGNGTKGYNGEGILASSALVNEIYSVTSDASGNIFFTEYLVPRVRMISASDSKIYTVAGTGFDGYNGDVIHATACDLNFPATIRLDAQGNIIITTIHRLRKIEK